MNIDALNQYHLDRPCCPPPCCLQHAESIVKATFGRIPRSLHQPSPAAAAVNAEIVAGAAASAAARSSSNGSSGAAAASAPGSAALDSTASVSDSELAPATPGTSSNGSGSGIANGALLDTFPRQRGLAGSPGLVRPPVEHQWGCSSPPVHGGARSASVSVFRHRLLQLYQLSIFCKLPVLPISTLDGLRWVRPACAVQLEGMCAGWRTTGCFALLSSACLPLPLLASPAHSISLTQFAGVR